tara:strand:- start:156 stop:890 length:735 start_codon:yes stop_codon:yes gene_type:complete
MKAIILAAGQSSRLYPLTKDTPKCLLEVEKNLSIIELQISLLNNLNISDILVVTGFQSKKIKQKLNDKVRFCFYPDFMKTNNLFTLNHIGTELDDDLIILFSDVILSRELLKECIFSPDDYNLLIDTNDISEKTMRVKLEEGSIIDLGSHIPVSEGDANFIGIAKYSRLGANNIRKKISELCKDDMFVEDYYTIALTKLARTGISINYTLNNNYHYWTEIDFLEDLENVRNNFSKIKHQLFLND